MSAGGGNGRPIVDGDRARVTYHPPGEMSDVAVPTTLGELLVRVCRITDSVRGPADALRAVLELKDEVDRWVVARPFPRNPVKGLRVTGPDGHWWVWTGAEWLRDLEVGT